MSMTIEETKEFIVKTLKEMNSYGAVEESLKRVFKTVEERTGVEEFCKVIETETTQILIKKDYDSEEDVLFVSIETSYENAMVTISPKLKVGATKEDQQNMFDKFVARAEEMGDNLVPAFLDMYK